MTKFRDAMIGISNAVTGLTSKESFQTGYKDPIWSVLTVPKAFYEGLVNCDPKKALKARFDYLEGISPWLQDSRVASSQKNAEMQKKLDDFYLLHHELDKKKLLQQHAALIKEVGVSRAKNIEYVLGSAGAYADAGLGSLKRGGQVALLSLGSLGLPLKLVTELNYEQAAGVTAGLAVDAFIVLVSPLIIGGGLGYYGTKFGYRAGQVLGPKVGNAAAVVAATVAVNTAEMGILVGKKAGELGSIGFETIVKTVDTLIEPATSRVFDDETVKDGKLLESIVNRMAKYGAAKRTELGARLGPANRTNRMIQRVRGKAYTIDDVLGKKIKTSPTSGLVKSRDEIQAGDNPGAQYRGKKTIRFDGDNGQSSPPLHKKKF